jgi:hypothetical protein
VAFPLVSVGSGSRLYEKSSDNQWHDKGKGGWMSTEINNIPIRL